MAKVHGGLTHGNDGQRGKTHSHGGLSHGAKLAYANKVNEELSHDNGRTSAKAKKPKLSHDAKMLKREGGEHTLAGVRRKVAMEAEAHHSRSPVTDAAQQKHHGKMAGHHAGLVDHHYNEHRKAVASGNHAKAAEHAKQMEHHERESQHHQYAAFGGKKPSGWEAWRAKGGGKK